MQQGFDQNFDVELEAPIALVAEVGVDAACHRFHFSGFAAPAFYLGEAGDAWLEGMALHVARHMLAVVLVVLNGVGAGAHQAHLTFEHIEQLGQLIQAPAPQHGTHGGDAGVITGGLLEAGLIASFQHTHAAELVHREGLAIEAVALLAKQNWPWARKSHHQGNQQQQGGDQQHTGAGEQQIKTAFELAIKEALTAAPEINAALVAHLIHGEMHRRAGPSGGIHHRH